MTGGNESTRYLTSANYFKQDGIIKNDGMTRFTARINIDQRLSRFVKVGITLSLSQNQYQNIALDGQYGGVLSGAVRFNPTIPVYDINGDYSIDRERLTADNPVALLDITDNSSRDRLLGMAYIEVEPIKGLTLKASLGADRRNAKRGTYYPKTVNVGKAYGGRANISESDAKDYLMDLTATYTKEIGAHNVTALAGYSWQGFSNKGFSAGNTEFLLDNFLFNNLGLGNAARPGVGSWADKNALGSYFARVNYSFLGRYLLTATVRADGDSDFNPDYRWGYFPSASLGWRFNDEAFMQPFAAWLSNGKIRVSYGQTGNSNVGNRILDTYGNVTGYTLAESYYQGLGITQLGNPKLKWETTTEFNLGLDLGFFNGRINLTAEYYNRVISDLLAGKSLLSYNEVTYIYANIGKTQGKGVEITLNTVNMKGRDFEWSTDLTWSRYRDRWLERDPEWKPAVYMAETDYLRSHYTYIAEGLMQAGEEAPVYNGAMLPGQIKVKDISGEDGVPDGKINDYDIVYKGTTDPDFYFGVNNTLRYKNFDLNIYFYGEINKTSGVGSYYVSYLNVLRGGQNVSPMVAEAWRHNNQGTSYQTMFNSASPWGDYQETKVSYLRCRNITLGYILPLPKKIVQRARVYVDVNNPFVITNWTGLDPETDLGSYSAAFNKTVSLALNPFPNVRSFTLGVDITF
jgi:TonB-linked SusC/RagA family outer membrane protein